MVCLGLSSNFWWLRRAKQVKLTEECVICTEKHVFSPKMFTNELNIGLLLWPAPKRHSIEWKYTVFPIKEKFREQ